MSIDVRFQTGGTEAINVQESRALVAFLSALHGIDLRMPGEVTDAVTNGINRTIQRATAAVTTPYVPPVPAAPTPAPAPADAAQSSTAPADDSASSTTSVPVPPTPPVPPAPSTGAPSGPAGTDLANAADLDAEGLPWDARIHSSNREKNKTDGLWRTKRNMDKMPAGFVDGVKAELRNWLAGNGPAPTAGTAPLVPSTPPVPPVPPVPPTPPAPAPVNPGFADGPANGAPPVPPVPPTPPVPPVPPTTPPAPAAPVAPPVPTPASGPAFLTVVKLVQSLQEQGMIEPAELEQAYLNAGLTGGLKSLPAAAKADPGIVARVEAEINTILVG